MSPKIVGAAVLGLPLVVVAWALLWRRNRPVFVFALVLIAVALGYLMATGATDDIAHHYLPSLVGPQPLPQ